MKKLSKVLCAIILASLISGCTMSYIDAYYDYPPHSIIVY